MCTEGDKVITRGYTCIGEGRIYYDELSVTCKNNYIAWNKSNVHGSQSSLKKCWHSDKEISVIIWKRANSKPRFKSLINDIKASFFKNKINNIFTDWYFGFIDNSNNQSLWQIYNSKSELMYTQEQL